MIQDQMNLHPGGHVGEGIQVNSKVPYEREAWYVGTSAAETFYDTWLDNNFNPAGGNDTVNTTDGVDTVVYAFGDGSDFLRENGSDNASLDVIRFTNLNPADVEVSRVGDDVRIKVKADGAVIENDEFFYSMTTNYGFDSFVFANGTTWDRTRINQEAWIRGTWSNDTLAGSTWDDTIFGDAGNDALSGGAGADILRGGIGIDQLNGGDGNDTFIIARGDGQDTILNSTTNALETLMFEGDIAYDRLWFSRSGNNLVAQVIGTDQQATVTNWYSNAAYHMDQVRSGDGSTATDTAVEQLVQAMATLTPPPAGQLTLTQELRDQLTPTLAATWTHP